MPATQPAPVINPSTVRPEDDGLVGDVWKLRAGPTHAHVELRVYRDRALIAEAVNVVIHIAGRGRKRRIESIARVVGFDGVGYQLADALETPFPELPPRPDAAPAAATSPSPHSLGELP